MCQYKQPIQKRNLITYLDKGFTSLVFLGQKIKITGKNFDDKREFLKLPIKYDLLYLPDKRICENEEKEIFLRNCEYFRKQKYDLLFKGYDTTHLNDLIRQFKAVKRNYVKLYDNESLLDTYLLNDTTGEIIPVYDFVKCGKCETCLSDKELHYHQKIVGQTESDKSKPLFVTLTYNEESYEKAKVNLTSYQVREIQLFLKRLRKLINGEFEIKYFAVSEFGKKFNRLHYHLLIFGVPDNFKEIIIKGRYVTPLFTDQIEKCWNKGYCKVLVANDTNVSSYLSKYLNKQTNIKLQSHHLGKDFLLSFKNYVINNNTNILEYNSYDGQYLKIYVNSHLLNLSLPTLARLVPKKNRDDITLMLYNLGLLKNKSYFHYVKNCIERIFGDKLYKYFNITPINVNFPYYSENQPKQKQIVHQLEIKNQIHLTLIWLEQNKSLILQGLENEEIRELRFISMTNFIDETIKEFNHLQTKQKIREYDNQ
jgi:hypothetical protein